MPLRLEYGPKDAAKSVVSFSRRDTGGKGTIPLSGLRHSIAALLEIIHTDMYLKAEATFRAHRRILNNWDEVMPALDAKSLVLIPSCLDEKCEDKIKELTTEHEDGNGGKKKVLLGLRRCQKWV